MECHEYTYLQEDYTKVEGIYTLTSNRVWADGVDPIYTPAECQECWRSTALSADILQFYVLQPEIQAIEVDLPPLEQMMTLSFRVLETVMLSGLF